jgi:hypothetical protein
MNKMHLAALAGIAAIASCSDFEHPFFPSQDNRPRDTSPKFYDRPNPNAMSKKPGKASATKMRKRK